MGVIIGAHVEVKFAIDENNIPYPAGESESPYNNSFQLPDTDIEIICFDSSFTIAKFRDPKLSAKFKIYFPESIPLEDF